MDVKREGREGRGRGRERERGGKVVSEGEVETADLLIVCEREHGMKDREQGVCACKCVSVGVRANV